jgi:hypothetical protein
MFEAVEQSALAPLPVRPFETVQYSVGTVAPDCHVKAGKAFYSVPWRLLGQKVTVRTAGDIVQVFHDDTVAATHVLHLTGRPTNFEHYPPHKVAQYHLMPQSSQADRSRCNESHRGAVLGQRHPPTPRDPGDHPAPRQISRRPSRCRLHPDTRTRRRALPHHQRTPRRGNRTRKSTRRSTLRTTTARAAPRTRRVRHRAERMTMPSSTSAALQPHSTRRTPR